MCKSILKSHILLSQNDYIKDIESFIHAFNVTGCSHVTLSRPHAWMSAVTAVTTLVPVCFLHYLPL